MKGPYNIRRAGLGNIFCFLITFCLGSPVMLSAQDWTMPVDGKVLAAGDKLAGAIITLYKGTTQLQQVVTTSNGRFSFELPPNAEYLIAITKPGYITKKFKINTANVPKERADVGGFNPFEPDVTLFEMPTAPEISKRVEAILSQPIAVYQYIPSETNFNYDEKYTQMIQSKLAELAQLQKQVEKEMQDKAKNSAVEAQKQLETDKKYKEAIAKADGAFASADYSSAKNSYNDALAVKPAEAYPKTKIAEINKLMADAGKQKDIDAQYQAAIKNGDAAFGKKDYAAAKTGYSQAAGIKPAEQYPKQKLSEIDKLLADAGKQKDIDAKYQAAISKGDGSFGSKDYASAKNAYTEASGIKPAEAYPKQKLSEIDKLMASAGKQKELDAKYQAAITKGDGAFGSKDYTSAKNAYTEAAGVKPSEQYPKQKLSEIDKLLADAGKQKDLDAKYSAAIAKGDAAFSAKDYAGAKTGYTDASGLKPAEQYPKSKLSEIDKLMAAMAKAGELDKQYKDLISKADNSFGKKDYTNARSSYSDAASQKSSEQYPKQKIAEIDKLLTDLAAQKSASERDQLYKDAVSKADKLFAAKNFPESKSAYNEALGVKPAEAYPKTKIAEINKLMTDAASASAQKELDAKYNSAIAKADGSFAAKDYTSARISYTEASGLKPAEQYPKGKIAEIDKIMADAASSASKKDLDAKYSATILKADNAFRAKDFATAKPEYAEASRIKPAEQYPKDKLSEIARIEKMQADALALKELNQQYSEAIARADKSFAQRDYPNAKSAYEEALGVKPNEKYPKDKIAQIENILNRPAQPVAQVVKKEPKQAAPVVSEEEKKKIYQSELRSKYPNGVTEEEYSDNGRTILRRVVIRDDYAGVYTKVMHNWGGIYFFKDNTPITEVVFDNESR